MSLDFKNKLLFDQIHALDEQAFPLRLRGNLYDLVQLRTTHSLLKVFLEDLNTVNYPEETGFEFLSGPTKTLFLEGKAYICRSFATYSQFQIVDSETFKKVDDFKSTFNKTICDKAFHGASKDWPSRFEEYNREKDNSLKFKIKESMIFDWLSRLKNTAYLINLTSNLLDMQVPGYVVEAAVFVHTSLYMGGSSFFEKRFLPISIPTPEMVAAYRHLWPETYLMWNYDGSCKTFSEPHTAFKHAIRSLDFAAHQLASRYNISNYKFYPTNFEVGYVRQGTPADDFADDDDDDDCDDGNDCDGSEDDIVHRMVSSVGISSATSTKGEEQLQEENIAITESDIDGMNSESNSKPVSSIPTVSIKDFSLVCEENFEESVSDSSSCSRGGGRDSFG